MSPAHKRKGNGAQRASGLSRFLPRSSGAHRVPSDGPRRSGRPDLTTPGGSCHAATCFLYLLSPVCSVPSSLRSHGPFSWVLGFPRAGTRAPERVLAMEKAGPSKIRAPVPGVGGFPMAFHRKKRGTVCPRLLQKPVASGCPAHLSDGGSTCLHLRKYSIPSARTTAALRCRLAMSPESRC